MNDFRAFGCAKKWSGTMGASPVHEFIDESFTSDNVDDAFII